MIAGIEVGDLVVADDGVRLTVHRVWTVSGRHAVTAPLGSPSPTEPGGAAWRWSRATGRLAGGGGAGLLRLATEEDLADHELAEATRSAVRRALHCYAAGSPATPEALLEAAEQLHWLTGGE